MSRIASGELLLIDVDGAGSTEFYCRHYAGLSCEVFALFDNDDSGRQGIENAIENGVLSHLNASTFVHSTHSNVELEDLASFEVQRSVLENYGYSVDDTFKQDKANFSIRLKNLARRCGKVAAKKTIHSIKLEVCAQLAKRAEPEDEDARQNLDVFMKRVTNFFESAEI